MPEDPSQKAARQSLAGNELARRAEGRIEFRSEPMRVRIELAGLISNDQHDLRCVLECSISVAGGKPDRDLLAEVLLADRQALHREEVSAHLGRRMREHAERAAGASAAEELLGGPARERLLESLRTAADTVAFSCGLIVLAPFQLDVESPSLSRARLESIQRTRAEERAAGHVEHLRRAGELLKQFQSIRESAGPAGKALAPGQVLQQIAPSDRGSTLEALLLASGGQTARSPLYAVAGPYLVRIEATDASAEPRMTIHALPTTLGPLRSVQPASIGGAAVLLVGASTGVMIVHPDRPGEARLFAHPNGSSPRGFNAVVYDESANALWAAHSDFGMVRWDVDSSACQQKVGGSPGAPRNLLLIGPRKVVFSVDKHIATLTDEDDGRASFLPAFSGADVAGILLDAARCYVVHEDGTIAVLDRSTLELIERQVRPGRIVAAAALPWMASMRILLSTENGAIECVGTDDQLVTQYVSLHRACRIIAASADSVAAVTPDRQRIILWPTWDGRRPASEVHVISHTRHRIADISFV